MGPKSAMHVNVQEFLREDVGYRRSFAITGERLSFDALKLTKDIDGEIQISRLDDGLLVNGTITTELELVCDRCLRSFTRPARISFDRIYRDKPEDDDDLPIKADSIDLSPLIEQELVLAQPIKQLDRPDCPGIVTKSDDKASAPSMRVADRARITKG